MALNPRIIVQAAIQLMDEIGLEKLTTRRLGERLGVEGPALYRHFSSKAELLDHMAAEILLPILQRPRGDQPWDCWLVSICHLSLKEVMKHRDGAKLVAQSLPIEPLDVISKPLHEAGFSKQDALYASKMFTRFMVGWQLHEDSEQQRERRAKEDYDHLEAFDFALGMMIDGLRHRLGNVTPVKQSASA